MNIEKDKWYVNSRQLKRYVHYIIPGKDQRTIVLYSTTGLEKDCKENLYQSFLTWCKK